jgi:excisionase family DNA binding protein
MDGNAADSAMVDGLDPVVYTARDVQRILKLSHGATYKWLADGTIPSIQLGKTYRVPRAALQALLDKAGK